MVDHLVTRGGGRIDPGLEQFAEQCAGLRDVTRVSSDPFLRAVHVWAGNHKASYFAYFVAGSFSI